MKNKKTIKIIALALILAFALSMFPSCSDKKIRSETFLEYFDTVTTVSANASEKDFSKILEISSEALEKYDKLFDIYNEYDGINNLCTVNKNAGKVPTPVAPEIIELLEYSKEMYTLTDGKINIAMGSVLSIWHSYRDAGLKDSENASLPPKDLLVEASKHTDINAIELNKENNEVYISDEKLSIDVGAIAKGFAVERLAKRLEKEGFTSVLISAGGNVRAIGPKTDGKPWTVAVSDPEGENDYPAILEISDSSVVTSGSYQRFYTVDGKNYHHIIDPETLMPSEYFVSVSICVKDSALADVLSTVLFIIDEEEGRIMCEKLDAEALWIYPSGEISITKGFPKK